jgi:protein involved in polysaccharide export with SLBB domain
MVGCIAVISLGGCRPVVQRPTALTAGVLYPPASGSSEYKIGFGDELEIKFFYTPELTTVAVVRPDGRINLPLIGDIVAARRSPVELGTQIRAAYASQVQRPDVTVNVRTFMTQRVFVGGEVTHPGVQALVGPLTVLGAIMTAEGFKDDARTSEVVIIRRDDEGRQARVYAVNLDRAISGIDPYQDLALQPADIVVVPRSGIGDVNVWVDQYIRKNLPLNFNVNYTLYNNVLRP